MYFCNVYPRAILVLAMQFPGFAFGCPDPDVITNGEVSIFADNDLDSGMYHIRAPLEYKGSKIELLVLTASSEIDGKLHQISMPLSIKSKNGVTGSYFHMSSRWLRVVVSANYENMPCTELTAEFQP